MDEYYPFVVLALGVAFIIFCIVLLRLHAFLALILAAIFVGIIADRAPDPTKDTPQIVQALEATTEQFGVMMGKIGVVIVLASIIGKCLMDSGAADKIVRRFLAYLSEKYSGLALLGSAFVLSVPVFFDTVFYLLVPLAKSLRLRTGKNYLLYIMCVCAGGALTHSLVAPTPGPLVMTEQLHMDLGTTIVGGLLFSIIPAILGGWFFSLWLNRRMDIPLREVEGFSLSDLKQVVERSDDELPSFALSILPIALPVLLIASATIFNNVHKSRVKAAWEAATAVESPAENPAPAAENEGNGDKDLRKALELFLSEKRLKHLEGAAALDDLGERASQGFNAWLAEVDDKAEEYRKRKTAEEAGLPKLLLVTVSFIGNKNFALLIATAISIYLLVSQRKLSMRELTRSLEPAIASAGVICLITSAGGAFGIMIKNAGVGDAVRSIIPQEPSGMILILIAFGIASVMKIAQGSGTVAIITASTIMWGVIGNDDGTLKDLPFHPLYIYLAIGFGSKPFSWMNDSGFWIVSKMSGFTEKETLKTWTVLLAVLGVIGLVQILIVSQIFPNLWG